MKQDTSDSKGAVPGSLLSVDFLLSIYNRTGKYFVGRDIIDSLSNRIDRILMGRFPAPLVRGSIPGRVAGKLMHLEIGLRMRSAAADRTLPKMRPTHPVIHLDPMSVVYHRLEARDVVLCHDVGPLTHPHLFLPAVVALYDRAYGDIARAGPRMVFMSEATATAFRRCVGGSYADERVIHAALRTGMEEGAEEPVPGLDGPFLLTVGAVGARKNQLGAITAFERSGLADEGVRYVVCGGIEYPGHEAVEETAARTRGVVRLGYVSDAQLRWLYRNAHGFVLASFLEGFGVPVAEAAAHGLVPLVSRGGVLEEVAGPGALAADPSDRDEIAAGMRRLVAMEETERAERVALLSSSVTRFGRERFLSAWREAAAAL